MLAIYFHSMMASLFGAVTIVALVCLTNAATELLQNGDFESSSVSNNWMAIDCSISLRSDDKFHGNHSLMVSNR